MPRPAVSLECWPRSSKGSRAGTCGGCRERRDSGAASFEQPDWAWQHRCEETACLWRVSPQVLAVLVTVLGAAAIPCCAASRFQGKMLLSHDQQQRQQAEQQQLKQQQHASEAPCKTSGCNTSGVDEWIQELNELKQFYIEKSRSACDWRGRHAGLGCGFPTPCACPFGIMQYCHKPLWTDLTRRRVLGEEVNLDEWKASRAGKCIYTTVARSICASCIVVVLLLGGVVVTLVLSRKMDAMETRPTSFAVRSTTSSRSSMESDGATWIKPGHEAAVAGWSSKSNR